MLTLANIIIGAGPHVVAKDFWIEPEGGPDSGRIPIRVRAGRRITLRDDAPVILMRDGFVVKAETPRPPPKPAPSAPAAPAAPAPLAASSGFTRADPLGSYTARCSFQAHDGATITPGMRLTPGALDSGDLVSRGMIARGAITFTDPATGKVWRSK